MPSEAQLRALFNAFDTDGSGFIDQNELQAALDKGGKAVEPEQCMEILLQVDKNNDGKISFEEFDAVFKLAPDALPIGLKQLVDVASLLLGTLGATIGMVGAGVSFVGSGVGGLARGVSSMVMGAEFDISDTNVALIGSDEDKAARKSAAETEEAWWDSGKKPGVEVWRIEKFKVVKWPVEKHGTFYEGDSYIVLHTYKQGTLNPKLMYDVYFWLGAKTSRDEMGTAAYKTVELDDLLDGAPIQHREVMKHESEAFKGLFKSLSYLKGGVDSAFNHVEPGAYVAKLLQVKKIGKVTSIVEVKCARKSLNEGDAFILDAGIKVYVWAGADSSPFEKMAANLAAENLERERAGKAKATSTIDADFWAKLGGEGPIKSKEEAGEVLPTMAPVGEGVLFKLSDATGTMSVTEVARGDLKKNMLGSDDVYIVDSGPELIVWVGGKASDAERAAAFNTASKYLKHQRKPIETPVSVLKEGQTQNHALFKKIFAN